MNDTTASAPTLQTAGDYDRRARRRWWWLYATVLAITLLLGAVVVPDQPRLAIPLLLVGALAAIAIIYQPRFGLYASVFLTLVGDAYLLPWYPFTKNFSSPESVLYLNDGLIISPLNVCVAFTLVAWLGHQAVRRRWAIRLRPTFWLAAGFALALLAGLVYGVATGGDLRIGLWEIRPMLGVPLVALLVANLITERQHVSQLMWTILSAIAIEGLIGVYHYVFILKGELGPSPFFTEHAAAIHMDMLFVFTLAVWLYRGSLVKRLALPLLALPVAVTYLASQRRAAMVALIVALMVLALILYQRRRRAFWLIMPPIAVAGLVYLAMFWNSSGALAVPARAVKAVLAPATADLRDQSSDQYRAIENVNILFTLQQAPLTGVGFGQKYHILVPLPDISFFEWWQYFTHNSVLWIWIEAGLPGFVMLLVMVGWAIHDGTQVLGRMPPGDLSATALTAVLFVMMHFIFAYVDISWDDQSMILLGVMLGLISVLDQIAARPTPLPAASSTPPPASPRLVEARLPRHATR